MTAPTLALPGVRAVDVTFRAPSSLLPVLQVGASIAEVPATAVKRLLGTTAAR